MVGEAVAHCALSASRGGQEGDGKDPQKTQVPEEKARDATVHASFHGDWSLLEFCICTSKYLDA